MRGYFSQLFLFYRRRPVISLLSGTAGLGLGTAAYWLPLLHSERSKQSGSQSLNPVTFTPYLLVAKQRVSPSSCIFTLRPPPALQSNGDKNGGVGMSATASATTTAAAQLREVWEKGESVWSVQAKQPQLQIGRSYTPLPPTTTTATKKKEQGQGQDQGRKPSEESDQNQDEEKEREGDIRLLVRKEVNGEMTTYLHGLPLRSTVELRGPYGEVRLPAHVKEVLFLAGGTGIAPALQVAHVLLKRSGAKMHVLWASKRREECVGGMSDGQKASSCSSWGGKLKFWATPYSTRKDIGTDIAEKGAIVQALEDAQIQAVEKALLKVEYFVDEENKYIQLRDISKHLETTMEKDSTPGSRLILVSGPDGFVNHWAGQKVWTSGQEVQGQLGGVLGNQQLNGWKVWKL